MSEEKKKQKEIDENAYLKDEDTNIGISRYAFNSFRIERSIRDLLSWEERGKVAIPNFQRDFVWDFNRCCKFIETILLNMPVPDLFLFQNREKGGEEYILIDGLQRFTCIQQFVNGEYKAKGSRKKFVLRIPNSEWDGKSYTTLSEGDKELFGDYSLRFDVLDALDQKESIKKLYMSELFERINTGAEKLTSQEIRNAVYEGKTTKAIKELALLAEVKHMYADNEPDRCSDQELLLRIMSYYHIHKRLIESDSSTLCDEEDIKISGSKKEMLSQYLYCANKNYINWTEEMQNLKGCIIDLYKLEPTIFCGINTDGNSISKRLNETITEALLINMMMGKQFCVSEKKFNQRKFEYWNKTDKSDNPFYSKTTNPKSVVKRVEIISEMMG